MSLEGWSAHGSENMGHIHSLGAKRKDNFCVPILWPRKSTIRNAIEMGRTLSATTGATTAKPPTLEVTETAGVRIPSAMVHDVAKRVYRTQ